MFMESNMAAIVFNVVMAYVVFYLVITLLLLHWKENDLFHCQAVLYGSKDTMPHGGMWRPRRVCYFNCIWISVAAMASAGDEPRYSCFPTDVTTRK